MNVAWNDGMKKRLIQAYRQAPWRVQLQWIGLFSLGLIIVALVAGVYLSVSAQASTAGRDIQYMTSEIETLQREISSLNTQLAQLTSASQMEARALGMGYEPIETGEQIYMVIPGAQPPAPVVLAPAPGPGMVRPPLIQPDYTLSLWDLLFDLPSLTDRLSSQITP